MNRVKYLCAICLALPLAYSHSFSHSLCSVSASTGNDNIVELSMNSNSRHVRVRSPKRQHPFSFKSNLVPRARVKRNKLSILVAKLALYSNARGG